MYYLAIDLGAGSGRGIVYYLERQRLVSEEVYRFKDYIIKENGDMYWDIAMIFESVKIAISNAKDKGYTIGAIGIDSWGVDYAVMRGDGGLDNPYHYRHKRTRGVIEDFNNNVLPDAESYAMSGIAPNEFNTIYQLYKGVQSGQFDKATKIMFVPNALGYLLTGRVATEPTIASTSGFYHKDNGYISELLDKIGFDKNLLPEVLPTGSVLGVVKPDIMLELDMHHRIEVIMTAGHDTAAAVACVATGGEDSLFLSSGTWSLFGSVMDSYLMTEDARLAGYTNELAVDGVRLLKNISGMWMIQECMRRWTHEDNKFNYQDIDRHIAEMPLADTLINVCDASFLAPEDMVDAIEQYIARTGQKPLTGRYEIALAIYTSLALEYRYSLDELVNISGKAFGSVNVFGGGSRNALLCQLTADSLKLTVNAGISEASSCGNAAICMLAKREIKDLATMTRVIGTSYNVTKYYPRKNKKMNDLYEKYTSLKSTTV